MREAKRLQHVWMRSLAVAVALGMAARVSAGVYDDVAAWWHFDYDVGGDNLVTSPDEIRDQRDWSGSGLHANQIRGSLEWTGAAGARPAGGVEYGGKSLLFTPDVDGGMNVLPDTFRRNGFAVTGSFTALTRFRWDDFASDTTSAWMYNNAFAYGAEKGLLWGMNGVSNLVALYGQTFFNSGIHIEPGTWYDAAIVVTDNGTNDRVEFYAWETGGAMQYNSQGTSAVTNDLTFSSTLVGGEADPTTHQGGNAKKAFAGAMNHLAIWDRALSTEEVNHAFGYPQHVFRLGLDNNINRDLRLESAVDADYTPGEPWHEVRRALTSGSTPLRVHFTLRADEANLDYVFHMNSSAGQGGQTADFSVYVNGQDLGTQTIADHTDYYWNVYDDVLVTGANTLEVRYEAGPSAWMSFDWMELTGSWVFGGGAGRTAPFVIEGAAPDDFYVTNPDWSHMERAMTAGDPDINIHFELSDELAANYGFVYDMRVIQQGGTPSTHPFNMLVNGTLVRSMPAQTNGTVVTMDIGSATLVGGDNTITISYNDTGGWLQFDYHRLRVTTVPPEGTVFIVR